MTKADHVKDGWWRSAALPGRLFGAFLLAVVVVKAYSLGAPDYSGYAIVHGNPWLQVGILEYELLLGIWLLWGALPALSWLAAAATLATFVAVNIHQISIGQATCECFGKLSASPWIAL